MLNFDAYPILWRATDKGAPASALINEAPGEAGEGLTDVKHGRPPLAHSPLQWGQYGSDSCAPPSPPSRAWGPEKTTGLGIPKPALSSQPC